MKKLVIPLFIPAKFNKVDYDSLKNIILDIEDSIILIGDYELNNFTEVDYIKVYLFLRIINPLNEYYLEKNQTDKLIKNFTYNSNDHYISKIGNIFSSEIKEKLENDESGVIDKSLNGYLLIFEKLLNNNLKEQLEYLLIKKKKIISNEYKILDNLIGINEL